MGDGPVSLLAVGIAAVVAGFYGGLLYAAGISAINLFSGYGHGDIFDIIILVICILVVGFTCYSISWRGKSSSLSKNGKKSEICYMILLEDMKDVLNALAE